MTLQISDNADEFRIEISGDFIGSEVNDTGNAWQRALLANTPRRISVDITRMTGYDHAGYRLLRDMHVHGTHIGAGTPKSLEFFFEISGPLLPSHAIIGYGSVPASRRDSSRRVLMMPSRAAASGE